MKKLKKLGASLLALVMVMAMMAPTMAAGTKPVITVPANSEGHNYNVYQIFTGEVTDDGESFNPETIGWGADANPTGIVAALQGIATTGENCLTKDYFSGLAKDADARAVAAALRPARGVPADEKLIAQALKLTVGGTGRGELKGSAAGGAQLPVDPGYYLIDDTSDEDGLVLVQVTGDLTFQLKSSKAPKMYKKVQNAAGQWVDATDYKIGDKVKFRLVATLPKGYQTMTEYGLTFHDVLDDGLTFQNDVTVTYFTPNQLDGQGNPPATGGAIVAGRDWRVDTLAGGIAHEGDDKRVCDFEVVIANAKTGDSSIRDLEDGSVIVVEYTAELNDQAKIGNPGNLNTAWVTDTKGNETPESPVGVFTFELGITKTNADGSQNLSGAKFELKKWDPTLGDLDKMTEAEKEAAWESIAPISTFTAEQVQVKNTDGTDKVDAEGNPVMENGPLFELDSLDAGIYQLKETEAPEGYHGLESPIEFTVSYETAFDNGKPVLTAVTAVTKNTNQTLTGKVDGTITGSITNYTGVKLPETGGIGTTIFYILGGALAVGAVVLLITKRRVGSSDDE